MQSTAVSTILALAIATASLARSEEEQRRLTPSDIAVMAKSGTGAGNFGCPGNPDHGVVRRPNGSRALNRRASDSGAYEDRGPYA
jgi:hypothetical protein